MEYISKRQSPEVRLNNKYFKKLNKCEKEITHLEIADVLNVKLRTLKQWKYDQPKLFNKIELIRQRNLMNNLIPEDRSRLCLHILKTQADKVIRDEERLEAIIEPIKYEVELLNYEDK